MYYSNLNRYFETIGIDDEYYLNKAARRLIHKYPGYNAYSSISMKTYRPG